MIKRIYLLLVVLCNCVAANAQYDCSCANTATPQKYKALADAGKNVQICSQCAALALYQCICDCKTTGMTKEQLETSIQQIESTLREYERMGNDICCKELLGRKSKCPNAGIDNGKAGDKVAEEIEKSQTAADLNNNTVSFANALGALSNDPDTKKALNDINKRHETFGNIKTAVGSVGANANQLDAIDKAETIAHLGSFFLGSGATDEQIARNEDIRKANTRSWNKVVDRMDKMSAELKKLHAARIPDYDNTTAKYRLLYLKYRMVPNKQEDDIFFTEDKLEKLAAEVERMEAKGTDFLKNEIDKISRNKKFSDAPYDYLRNRRTNDSVSTYVSYLIPKTFNVPVDKVLKIEKTGESKVTYFFVTGSQSWFDLVFETDDINKYWDGNYKKVPQPAGIYKYKMEGYDMYGQYFLLNGSFTLIR